MNIGAAELASWVPGPFSVSYQDLQDINNSIDWMLLDAELSGEYEPDISRVEIAMVVSMGRQPSEAVKRLSRQIVRNYFLVRGVTNNNLDEVKSALSAGAQVNEVCLYAGKRITPIVGAAQTGSLELVQELINNGADPNKAQANGESALGIAINYDYYAIAKLLLENGANSNQVAHHGITPLAVAENSSMVRLLLQHGADPNIADVDGDLPIIARIDNNDIDSVRLLIDAGTDVDRKNDRGESAREHGLRSMNQQIRAAFQ